MMVNHALFMPAGSHGMGGMSRLACPPGARLVVAWRLVQGGWCVEFAAARPGRAAALAAGGPWGGWSGRDWFPPGLREYVILA